MARIDWDIWRKKFVQGPDDLDFKRLSEYSGAPAYQSLRNRSSKEDWPEQRKRYRDNIGTLSSAVPEAQQVADRVAKIIDSAEMLARHAAMSKSLQTLAATWLQTLKVDGQPHRYDPEKVGKLKAGEVHTLLKMGVDLERLTEGLSTERTEVVDISAMSDADLERLANGGSA